MLYSASMNGEELRRARERLDLTQEQLAALLDVTANTIARWERNEVPIKHAKMLKLALSALKSK